MTTTFVRQIAATAAAGYRGPFATRFARGKLAGDPLFATLLATGAIPDAACLVDLGCGQALLAVWMTAARDAWTRDAGWPPDWPAPPKIGTYLGIDRSRADIGRAKPALPAFARVFRGDVRTLGTTLLDRCDVVTLLDVLHYLEPAAQETLIAAIARGLPPWGVVVLRVGDGAAAAASRRGDAVDLVVSWLRGHPHTRLHRRSIDAWTALFAGHGFVVETLDDPRTRDGADRYANVLLRASRRLLAAGPEAATPGAVR